MKVGIGCLEGGIEAFKDVAVVFLEQNLVTVVVFGEVARVEHIKQRLVILIHKHHATLARGSVDICQQLRKAFSHIEVRIALIAVLPFPRLHHRQYKRTEFLAVLEVGAVEVDMEHGVCLPFLFEFLHGKAFEEFLLRTEIAFQRGDEQTLSEASRTTQKVDLALVCHVIYECGLIDVCVAAFDNRTEVLYADWEFHCLFMYLFMTQ